MLKPGHMKRNEENREYVTVRYNRMTQQQLSIVWVTALSSLKECVDNRFASLHNPIYRSMHWANPAHWQEDASSELESIDGLAEYFATTLAMSTYDKTKAKREWKNLKILVNFYYRGARQASYGRECSLTGGQNSRTYAF